VQAANGMRLGFDMGITPAERNVWMVLFFFCDGAHMIYEVQCLCKVSECEGLAEPLGLVVECPAGKGSKPYLGLTAREGFSAFVARFTALKGKILGCGGSGNGDNLQLGSCVLL
jgi:hypothetical protein